MGGQTHILVLIDDATCYPEVTLCSINASALARELVTVFSWVGFPKQILVDQGTTFTSRVLVQL